MDFFMTVVGERVKPDSAAHYVHDEVRTFT